MVVTGAAILIVVAIVAVCGYVVFKRTSATHAAPALAPSPSRPAPPRQVALPFQLVDADGLEADSAGNVCASDAASNQVLELKAGSDNPIALPFTGLKAPGGLAADGVTRSMWSTRTTGGY